MTLWILSAVLIAAVLAGFNLAGFYWVLALILWIEVGSINSTIGLGTSLVLFAILVLPAVVLVSPVLRRSLVTPVSYTHLTLPTIYSV